jgi:hypothetical protein
MKRWLGLALVLALGAPGLVAAQDRPAASKDCPQPAASPRVEGRQAAGPPARIEGQIVGVDPARGEVTVRTSDGTLQKFRGSRETLDELKVGDRLEAKLRAC